MSSKLSDHIFKKGKFITPWNFALAGVSKMQSWSLNRLPEYLWLGLIIEEYGRKEGLEKAGLILNELNKITRNLSSPALPLILKLDIKEQKEIYSFIVKTIDANVLTPLTLLYTYSDYPEFSRWFCNPQSDLTCRQEKISNVLNEAYFHQSEIATDIRFLVYYFNLRYGDFNISSKELDFILEYPRLEHSDEKMHLIRPMIRSAEMVVLKLEILNEEFLEDFWRRVSKMSDCKLVFIKFPNNELDANRYIELLHEIFQYVSSCFKSINPLDTKILVLLGISTFSYKRLVEIVDHNLFNTIAGRSAIRTVVECYIMMKYLLKNEKTQENIWEKYQYYGIGLYKVVLARSRECNSDLSSSHIDYRYLEILVNEYLDEEFIDMDTSYFDKQSIREKAIAVDEKELFGLYYDYDSSYEHALWGAIRESSLLKCESPAHQYHCVPDYENNQNLKNVWPDCVMVMNKILGILNEVYSIPELLYNEVIDYAK